MAENPFTASPRFPTIDEATWRKAAEASLKGARFEDRLVAQSYDSIAIAPLYTEASSAKAVAAAGVPGAAPFVRGAGAAPRDWRISQRIDLSDPTAANAQALDDLEGGANGLIIACGASGVKLPDAKAVGVLMAGIRPELIAITLEGADRATADLFLDYVVKQGLAPASLAFFPGFAPLAAMAQRGTDRDEEALSTELAALLERYEALGISGPLFLLDGRPAAEALASEGQEIAFILAQALAYLRLFERAGVPVEAGLQRLAVKITVDADQFLSLAKLRALRLVLARMVEALGLPAFVPDIRAETAWRMLSARDPWVNVLRATTACFAAAAGGADEITLHPFSAALGRPDGLARRIARNMQAILMEESGLARVVDPAGGSYYVESLTQGLAEQAWSVFQAIEQAGGFIAALRQSRWQSLIAETREKRLGALKRRHDKVTGVSEFPDIHEAAVPVAEPWGNGAPSGTDFAALPRLRLAEGFEALRDRAEAAAKRPSVFLANLGSPADTIARATFAKNFFEVGGIEALSNDGFADIQALVAAFQHSGTRFACLCSSDAIYQEKAADAARALREAGADFVALAGNPREERATLTEAGIDCFVYAGMDMIAALSDIQRQIGL